MVRAFPAIAAAIAWLATGWNAAAADDRAPGLHEGITFRDYPALARNSELLARVFTPLTLAEIRRDFARKGKTLAETSLDPGKEKFLVYVPAEKPPEGYGLLVFVPPWQTARLPRNWGPVLDRFGMIFVTAARSGNDEDIVSRREPLALIAAAGAMAHYPVDPSRIFIGGMSGGARMALRLALAYPDLFRGALLNSGSDVIGTVYEPLPSAALFARFQTGMRLLYLTGDADAANVESENRSRRSMKDWCVSDVRSMPMAFTGHEVVPARLLGRALDILTAPDRPDPEKMAACRAALNTDVATALGQVDVLIANGKLSEARSQLKTLDAKFGGLATPRSTELDTILTRIQP